MHRYQRDGAHLPHRREFGRIAGDRKGSQPAPPGRTSTSHYLGGLASVLGRYDEADAYFAQAAAFSERFNAKFFAARTDLSWGNMLAERHGPGDTDHARELLSDARANAAANGYATVERRAAQGLQHLE